MMPKGKYYIGDLCYVMHPQWDEFCSKTVVHNEVIDGEATVDIVDGEISLDSGVKVMQFATDQGDGIFEDQLGNEYPVDAGLIGCILVDDIDDPDANLEGGNIIEFESDFSGFCDDGLISIGHILINTKNKENYKF